jgi:hypothetical protein
MSDRSLTLFALHLEDASIQIGPKRIDRSSGGDADRSDAESPADETASGGGANPLAVLAAVVLVLVTVAGILGRIRGSTADREGIELEDEPGGE